MNLRPSLILILLVTLIMGCTSTDHLAVSAQKSLTQDCPECPHMVLIPAGEFMMGASSIEAGLVSNEVPQHRVTISKPFAVSKFEITRKQYAAFIRDTNYASGNQCAVWTGARGGEQVVGKSWSDPNFPQTDDHPVVCISWSDAKAYIEWLEEKTGKPYRLLTESEWEYAARAGTTSKYYFGNDEDDICEYANVPDQSAERSGGGSYWTYVACDDGYAAQTSPVGSYLPNSFGLYDMHANVWEWVEDCYHGDYIDAPDDGSAWLSGSCEARVVRGGSLTAPVMRSRSASRWRGVFENDGKDANDREFTYHNFNLGLRVALTIE